MLPIEVAPGFDGFHCLFWLISRCDCAMPTTSFCFECVDRVFGLRPVLDLLV